MIRCSPSGSQRRSGWTLPEPRIIRSAWQIGRRYGAEYAQVEIQICDGVHEAYCWTAVFGFLDTVALPRPLLGYSGFLQYFDAEFRGADLEVLLIPNRSVPWRLSLKVSSGR